MTVKREVRGLWVVALVAVSLLAMAVPAAAQAPDVVLYELTENMKLVTKGNGVFVRRAATSALTGVATTPSAVCAVPPCWFNASAHDNVSFATATGPVSGEFTQIVHGDNFFDAPELVVTRGNFRGQIDFTPVFSGVPLGTMTGSLTLGNHHGNDRDGGRDREKGKTKLNVVGLFRQPFLAGAECPAEVCGPESGLTVGQVLCGAGYTDAGYAYVIEFGRMCQPLQPHEFGLGGVPLPLPGLTPPLGQVPLVRFEIYFTP
jgi:hypothetical protein